MWIVWGLLTSLLVGLLVNELSANLPWIAEQIVKLAERRLHPSLRDRLGEEWRAYLLDYPGGILKVFNSLGFLFASFKLGQSTLDPSQTEGIRENTASSSNQYQIKKDERWDKKTWFSEVLNTFTVIQRSVTELRHHWIAHNAAYKDLKRSLNVNQRILSPTVEEITKYGRPLKQRVKDR